MNREGKSEWNDDVKLDYWQDEWTTNYLLIRYNDKCIEETDEDDSADYGGTDFKKYSTPECSLIRSGKQI